MKPQIKFALFFAVMLCLLTAFCACGADPPHTHTLTHHEAQAATCTQDGNIAYWSCSGCNQNFSDAGATAEAADVTIPAAHTGETELRGVKAPTEEEEGYTGDLYCLDCGGKIADGEAIAKLPHTHALQKTEQQGATCTTDGNIEYFTCTKCQKHYTDEAATQEISLADTVVPAAHTLTYHAAVKATCKKEGSIAYWSCSVCSKNYTSESATQEATVLTTAVDPNAHRYLSPTWEWNGYTSATASFVCEHDATHTAVVPATVTSAVTTVATCVGKGERTYTAKVYLGSLYRTDEKTEELGLDAANHADLSTSGTFSECEGGTKNLRCRSCRVSWQEPLTAAGHNYVDGICTKCDAEKPTNAFVADYVVNGDTLTVTVTVKLTGVVKVAGFKLTISYDPDVLYLEETQQGAFTATENKDTAGSVILVHTNATSTTAEGTALTLTFAIDRYESTDIGLTVNEIKEAWYDNSIHDTESSVTGVTVPLAQ